jgi:hypothetical protein
MRPQQKPGGKRIRWDDPQAVLLMPRALLLRGRMVEWFERRDGSNPDMG